MSESVELLAAQLQFLQIQALKKRVSDKILQLKTSHDFGEYGSKLYLLDHAREITTQGLFLDLIKLYEDNDKLLQTVHNELVKSVDLLCKKLKEQASESEDDLAMLNKPLDYLTAILEKAEEVGGLEKELDLVYESISELREAGTRIDIIDEKLKQSLKKLLEMTELQGRLLC